MVNPRERIKQNNSDRAAIAGFIETGPPGNSDRKGDDLHHMIDAPGFYRQAWVLRIAVGFCNQGM
jgi:hypothetical protein